MLITHHWSATGPYRIKDYHLEYALAQNLDAAYLAELARTVDPAKIDWKKLHSHFTVWKNFDFHTATTYGTYLMNHDPRDNSPDVEIGALCMGGEHVTTTGTWGSYPFTTAHAWLAVGLTARVAEICDIDISGAFPATRSPYQNGPIYNVSTHAERAYQTYSDAATDHALGYLLHSGDPDCRWDLAVLQQKDNSLLGDTTSTVKAAQKSAQWIRTMAHLAKAAGISDMWNLDKGVMA